MTPFRYGKNGTINDHHARLKNPNGNENKVTF